MSKTFIQPLLSGRTSGVFPATSQDAQRLAWLCVAFLLALLPPTILAATFETRQLNDINLWIKPMHFELSLAVHFASLALFLSSMDLRRQSSRLMRWAMRAAAVAMVGEIAYLLIQASRGRHSHFNTDTSLEAFFYQMMGIGATALVFVAFVEGLLIWRSPVVKGSIGLHFGAAFGLVLGAVTTFVVASIMASGAIDGPGHWVGGVHSDSNGLPVVGWSTTGGDLRVPHFFATHAMQAMPLFGLLADRLWPHLALRRTICALVVWATLIAATFAQALAGLPLLRI